MTEQTDDVRILTYEAAAEYVREHFRTHDYGYQPVVLEPRPGQEPGSTDLPFVAVDDGLEEPSIFTVWLEQRADGTRYIYGEW